MLFKLVMMNLMLVSLASFTSCSKLDDMGKNAKDASNNSGKAATAADESRGEIADGRVMTRAGATSATRDKALENMEDARTFNGKKKHAAKYMYAFEFQFWTGKRHDDMKKLETMKEKAMGELFEDIVEINGVDLSLRTPNPLEESDQNIHAMAVTLHVVHDYQELVAVPRESELKATTSVYDLLKEGIKSERAVAKGMADYNELEAYEKIVHENIENAIALVQARLNMLLTINLMQSSSIKENGKVAALALLLQKKKVFTSKFRDMNLAQKERSNRILNGAKKVKDFLESVGVDIKLDDKIVKFYSKMIVAETEDLDKKSKNISTEVKLLKEQRELLNQFFKLDGHRMRGLNF